MLRDHAEASAVYVITPVGEAVDVDELKRASLLSHLRGFKANEMCPRIGQCAIHVHTEQFVSESGESLVDAYSLACDAECALLIDEPASEVIQDL